MPADSSFSCGVTAKLPAQTVGGQSVGAQSLTAVTGFISSLTTIPFLVTQQRLHNGRIRTLPAPHITPDIAVGATNTCFGGIWTGDPTLSFAWYKQGPVPKKRTIKRTMILLHQGQTFVVTPNAENKDLVCVVTASNLAGKATAVTNDYIVPIDPPVALQPPSVLIQTAEPANGSALVGAQGADVVAEQIDLTCDPPQWNRPDVTIQVGWYTVAGWVYDASTNTLSNGWQLFAPGATLDLDMRPGNLQLSGEALLLGDRDHEPRGIDDCLTQGRSKSGTGAPRLRCPCPVRHPTSDSVLDNVAAVTIDAATGGVFLTIEAAGVDSLATGLGFGSLTDPTSSTEVYTYGPNCGDYQQYWMGQGFTVKQQPGDGPS